MINKKNIWFLTLFSLILVLSVYYITMPSELLLTNNSNFEIEETKEKATVEIEESEILDVMKEEAETEYLKELDTLKLILTNKDSSVDEKNDAFDKMKKLNINKTKETELEKKIEEEFNLKSFIKIENDQIKVVVEAEEHNTELANKIMRFIQNDYESKMYITVEFK